MKLTDLNPKWIDASAHDADGGLVQRASVGIEFDCPGPCCVSKPPERRQRLFVPLANPLDGGPPSDSRRANYTRTGDSFESLTLEPELDFDQPEVMLLHGELVRIKFGHWRGRITNGEVT
jgi:hypothetical protein